MRSLNFSAGPSSIPFPVYQRIKEEISSYAKGKYWVAEISHRSQEFINLASDCKKKIRQLLEVPKNYEILFLHGGMSMQYPLLPMNFLQENEKGAYFITGHWSKKAWKLAYHPQIFVIPPKAEKKKEFLSIPQIEVPESLGYLFVCDNETVHGIEMDTLPDCKNIILDVTSNVFTKKIDYNRVGVLLFSTQKNLGISGLGVMIVREDFLQKSKQNTNLSPILNYYEIFKNDSMVNTPNTFAIYVANLCLDWMIEKGGTNYFQLLSKQKSELLYNAIDKSRIFNNFVEKKFRSRMNVVFSSKNPVTERLFLEQAEKEDFLFLKGHKAVGGIRASIYNAMDLEVVKKLVDFLEKFNYKYN